MKGRYKESKVVVIRKVRGDGGEDDNRLVDRVNCVNASRRKRRVGGRKKDQGRARD